MKIKILFLLAILASTQPLVSLGQGMQNIPYGPGGWYRNFEKYWWYRYRLVNDFMKLGTDCGESIPARKRTREFAPGATPQNGWMEWGDASQDLGHYLVATGLEHQILGANTYRTDRTDYENWCAQDALERLDKNAEAYCFDIFRTKYCNPNFTNLNGFFIRDDVPLAFLGNNLNHFNRPGIVNRTPVGNAPRTFQMDGGGSYTVYGAYGDYCRLAEISPTDWYNAYNANKVGTAPPISLTGAPPQYPVEESQDALSEMFAGLAISSKFLGWAGAMGQNLQQKANDNLWRMIDWAASGPGPWIIKNPVTGKCVYGVESPSYFAQAPGGCFTGGANMTISSPAVVEALHNMVGGSHNYTGMYISAGQHMTLFQAQQYITNPNTMYTENYVAFSRTWTFTLPWPFSLINTSWTRLRNHAMRWSFRTPHIPLLYKINYPNNGVDYCPECHSESGSSYTIPSYEELLDRSTFCGNYNYVNKGGNWGDWEWSNIDRLSHSDQRSSPDEADYNGVDYMELFNLYSVVKGDYLKWVFNPYYDEFYSINYPTASGLGSHTTPLKLNYLEYLSMINTIYSQGDVTVRGAKVIELLPGFNTQIGCYFEAYIKDYDCDAEGYCYAQKKTSDGQFTCFEYNPTGKDYNQGGDLQNGQDGHKLAQIAREDSLADAVLTPALERMYRDSLINSLRSSADYEIAALFPELQVGNAATSRRIETHTAGFEVLPNPNDGNFSIIVASEGAYTVKVQNAVGQDVYNAADDKPIHLVHLGIVSPGNYVAEVTVGTDHFYKKVTVIK